MGKFLNLDGLRLFWQKAKAYADGKHEELTAALKQHTENDHQLLSWQILSLGAGVQKTGAIMDFGGFVDTCQTTLVSVPEIKAAVDAGTAVVLFARDKGLFRLRIPSGESYKYVSSWTAYGALYAAADYKAGRMFRDTTTNLYYTWEGSSYAGATPLRLLGETPVDEELRSKVSENTAAIADLCSGAGENLLPGTNKGVSGWTAVHSDNGKMLLQSASGGKSLRVTNFMDTATPGWQTLTRSAPEGILAKGEKCVLSFKAIAATGDNAMCLFASVGDSAATRTVAQSEWFYIEAGKEVSCSVVLEGLIDGGSISDDLLKLGIVSGQNGGWKELVIWDVQLERGSTPTAYRPAPADTLGNFVEKEWQTRADAKFNELTDEINGLGAYVREAIVKSLMELEANQNRMGAQVCVLSGWDPLDFYDPENFPVGSAIFSDDDNCVYEVVNNSVTRKREFVLSERWNRDGQARTDVLYLYEGTWRVWDPGNVSLIEVPNSVPDAPNFSFSEL